jgi:hypothetical protein
MARVIVIAVILLVPLLGGCSTAAQRQAQLIGNGIQTARAEITACSQAVNSDPAFEGLAQHMPLGDMSRATLLQMTDSAKATPLDVNLLSERHSRLQSSKRS